MTVKKRPKSVVRQDIANVVSREIGLSQSESTDLVKSMFEKISEKLEAGENVKLSKFGNFIIRDKTERIGRNPKTGTTVIIKPRRVVSFKAASKCSSRITSKLKD